MLDDSASWWLASFARHLKADDVTATLDLALTASDLDQVKARHRLRLVSDKGPRYIADDLAQWIEDKGMAHILGAPGTLRRRARSSAGTRP